MFRASPEGLHSKQHSLHCKTAGQYNVPAEDAASSQQEADNKAAAYDTEHLFSYWPDGKPDTSFKQRGKRWANPHCITKHFPK